MSSTTMRETQTSCGLAFSFMFLVWILYHLESPFLSPSIEPKDVFNWTATCRRHSDIPTPYFRWVYYDERVKQNARLDHNYAANRTKKARSSAVVLLLIIGYSNVLYSPVCIAAWHPRHKTVTLIFSTISVSPSHKQ